MSSMFKATKTKKVKKDTSVPIPTGDTALDTTSQQRTFLAPPGVPQIPTFAAASSEEAELNSFDLDLDDLGVNPKTSTSWFKNPFRKRSRNISAQPQNSSILGSVASDEREEQQERAYPEEERKIPTDENNPADLILSPDDIEIQPERAAVAKFERQVNIMEYAPMNLGFDQMVQQSRQQEIEVEEEDDDDYLANLKDLVQFNPNSYGQSYHNEVHAMIEEALRSEKTAPYGRSKLMVVGEGRAGKTCTIRSLLNMVFDAEEASTKGFDVKRVHARDWKEDDRGYLVEQLEKLVNEKKRKDNKNKVKIQFTRNHFASMMDVRPSGQRKSSYESESDDLESMASDEAEKFADLRNNQAVDVEAEEVQRYGKNFNFSEKKEDTLAFSIWDFGGQKVFYSLHHLFLTEYGCYILVFNVLNLLNPSVKEATKEYLKFWLFSKKIHAPTAPILIVGTHSDEITQKDIKKLSTLLNKEVLSSNYFGEVHNKNLSFFPIDNKTNMGITELRDKIEKVVRKQEYIKRCVPLSFLRVIELLLEREEPYLGINEAKQIVERCSLDEYFFQAALNFLSQRGLITYFHEHETLRRFVILQPQWLIGAITDIVYDENEHNMPKFDNNYARDFRKFTEERVLTKDLLENIWNNKGYSDELQKFLIRIMCRSSLMCNYKFEDTASFLVPSLFTTDVSGVYHEGEEEESEYNGPSFVIDFSGSCNTEIVKDSGKIFVRYMPYGFFERVVCLCVEHSALFSDSIKPDIGDKVARLSFGTDVDFEMKVVNNLKGEPLWIKVSTEDETEMEEVISLVQNIYSMIDGLRNDFFAKNTETSKLAISLLLPSTPESGSFYADYAELSEYFAKKKLPKFIRPDKAHKKKVKVHCYKHWFPLHEGSTKYENLIDPADNLPSPVDQLSKAVQLSSTGTLSLPPNLKYHCFLSYKQSSAIDIVGKQYYILSSKGLNCWYDQQHRGTINLQSMMDGVKSSMCYVLFLSKDIFPSPYVEAEVKMALSLKKPIILLHHPDTGKVGYWDFGNYINNAPEVVKPLFSDIESIQLQRRHYLEKAVTIEIYNRISSIHKELVQSLI